MSPRRARALLTVVVMTGAMAAVGAPAEGDAVRTDTGLGGFSVSADAAPFKILVDDPSNPLPRPEESAIVEADPSFTLAEVATGPAARGVASTVWPGNLLGEGIGAATSTTYSYPVKAEARYPDKPFVQDDPAGGSGMHATAQGLEASGTAVQTPKDIPGSVSVGSVTSTTTAVVDKTDVAIGHSTSRVSDVTLLGLIHIGSVSTEVVTRSDGKKQSSTGATVVSGLSVAGVGAFSVDETGAHATGAPATGPLPLGQLDVLKAAGITIGGVSQAGTSDASGVTRDAKGLRITIDTTMYRKALSDSTPTAVTAAIYQAFGALPLPPQAATYKSFLYYTLSATPKLTFILGAGHSTTVANLPLSFTFPPAPTFGAPSGGGLFPPSTVGRVSAPVLPGTSSVVPPTTTAGADGQAPVVSAPTTVTASSSSAPDPFKGVGALLVLGALLAAGIGGWGLMRLEGLAMGAAAGRGCTLGAPSTIPDLRGATT